MGIHIHIDSLLLNDASTINQVTMKVLILDLKCQKCLLLKVTDDLSFVCSKYHISTALQKPEVPAILN